MSASSLLSTSIPDEEGAKKLMCYISEKQKNNLLKLLKSCEEKLRYDLKDLAEFIQKIDCNRKLSPAFFLYTQELHEAIKSSSIDSIMDAVQRVSWLKLYGVYEQELRISSVLSEFWEVSYVAKNNAAPGNDPTAAGPSPLNAPLKPPALKNPSLDWARVLNVSNGYREISTAKPAKPPDSSATVKSDITGMVNDE